jgi:sugar/nucleoside kinase (ribokinase family)
MKREQLAEKLRERRSEVMNMKAVTGFDGFVDEMISVVEERQSLSAFRRVEDISRFSELIAQAAGHSSLREIVVKAVHPGGCAVNMGDGLASLGIEVDTFATLGRPLHPAFADYGRKARLHSWAEEPGRTLAFEFADGKLMFSSVSHLAGFDADHVTGCLEDGAYLETCRQASLIAFTNWSLYPWMTEVWERLEEAVFSELTHRPWLLVDLVDPSGRPAAEIERMLQVLSGFREWCQPVLGLNRNEANVLCRATGLTDGEGGELPEQARMLRESLNLEQVVVHAQEAAACATAESTEMVDGPYCRDPLKSTGAGDRFNAGYALGLMLGLSEREILLLAVASSGFFVRNAFSAGLDELARFLVNWEKGMLDDRSMRGP